MTDEEARAATVQHSNAPLASQSEPLTLDQPGSSSMCIGGVEGIIGMEPQSYEPAQLQEQQGEQQQGEQQQQQRHQGSVKWFNATKGYGFVTPEEGGDELFVHQSNIKAEGFRSLREGEIVEFDVEPGTDGRSKAVNVSGPDGSALQGAPSRYHSKSSLPQGQGGRGMGMGRSGCGGGRGFYGYPAMGQMGPMPPMMGQMPPGAFAYPVYYFPQGGEYQGAAGGRGRGGPGPAGFMGQMGPMGQMGGQPMMYPPMQQMQNMSIHQPPLADPSGEQVSWATCSGLGVANGQGVAGGLGVVNGLGVAGGLDVIGGLGVANDLGVANGLGVAGGPVVVHNLPWTCTWQQLKDLFVDWKVERANVVEDHMGRSRGYGTVKLTNKEDAGMACEKLNDSTLDGRVISVRIDRFA
eukprot:gene30923-35978_t